MIFISINFIIKMEYCLKHKRSNALNKKPDNLEYGEIAINYNSESPTIYIKDDKDSVISFQPLNSLNSSLEESISLLDKKLENINTNVSSLDAQIVDINGDIETINDEFDTIDDEIETINDNINVLSNLPDTISTLQTNIETQISSITLVIGDLDSGISACNENIEALKKKVENDSKVTAYALAELKKQILELMELINNNNDNSKIE